MRRLSALLFSIALVLPALPAAAATLAPGDLIKASGPAVYYYATNGKRYVFPTEKTYMSWYADFSSVKTITDAELAAIQIGGNVTYRPGVRLVKVTTDPKVYAIEGTQLRWIASEALAMELFGANWASQVDDIPDPFFVNYTMGAVIDEAADYAPASVRDNYPLIQTTIDAPTPTPSPGPEPPAPPPPPAPTSTTGIVTLTPDKTTAQSNEQVFLLAETTYAGTVDRLELYADDVLITFCSAKSCSGTWVIPNAGVKPSYIVRAKLLGPTGTIDETTATITITSQPVHSAISLTADRSTIKPGQIPHIRSVVSGMLVPSSNEIYVDGTPVKVCVTVPGDCSYDDYLSGGVGTVHGVYALVTTLGGLQYRSETLVITVADNDSPMLSFNASLPEIFVGETVDLTATVQDDDGIATAVISQGGQTLKSCAGAAPCTVLGFPGNVAGTYTFTATATDLLGATSTAMTTVVVK